MAKWGERWENDLDDDIENQVRAMAQGKGRVAALACMIMFLCKVMGCLSDEIHSWTEEQA